MKELFNRDNLLDIKDLNRYTDTIGPRGNFCHFKDHVDKMSDTECKQSVNRIIKDSLDFLNYLKENRIFPSIITVLQYVIDRFNREYLVCVNEEGRIERIYTKKQIDPCKIYFLHPLTNPIRIYPHLIEYKVAE